MQTPQPTILPLNADGLPLDDLRPYPHAVTWQMRYVHDHWTKVPVHPNTGENASSTNARTWCALDNVLRDHDRVGFVVAEDDPFTMLDVDDSWDEKNNCPKAWAQTIINRFPHAYWERSTTGTGIKGLIRATPPEFDEKEQRHPGHKKQIGDGKLEVAYSGRFTTLTGHRLPESSPTIGDGQDALTLLWNTLWPATPPSGPSPISLDLDDRDIIERVQRTAKGHRLHNNGDWVGYPSQSEGDLALLDCYIFAGATDPHQLDRLYRTSALMRDKWERKSYRNETLDKALNGTVQPGEWTDNARQNRVYSSKHRVRTQKFQDGTLVEQDRIAELEELVETLERRVMVAEKRTHEAEAQIAMLRKVQSTTARINANKQLGQMRPVAISLTHRLANAVSSGALAKDVVIPMSRASVAEMAGTSLATGSKQIDRIINANVGLRKELEWVPEPYTDAKGKEHPGYKKQFIGLEPGKTIEEVAEALANYTTETKSNWGGRPDRAGYCEDHPHADIIKRTVSQTSYYCADCGALLGEEDAKASVPQRIDGAASDASSSVDTVLICASNAPSVEEVKEVEQWHA